MSKIYVGAAYYPELWEESEVERDIARCKQLGVNTLRIGEFAWSTMEPKEGEFHFEKFARVLDKLYGAGISVIFCTPTCTPPRWLFHKYEETRAVTPLGERTKISSRCHPCKTSPVMREKNRRIVEEEAKALAGHPAIIGWQIDNEFFPYGDGCYCPQCKRAFRDHLKARYGDIAALNRAWGMARWSLDYDNFDEIEPPYPGEWRHPSLRTAWWHFQSGQIFSYCKEQADILHRYGCKNVGTDMMQTPLLDYYKINESLDVVQYNHYNPQEELPRTTFDHDFMRCVKDKPYWVTETQVGWNGSTFAEFGYRSTGNCYANTWLPIARGAEMNLYWLFRAHPAGHELAHGALLTTAGRPYRVSEEVARASEELQRAAEFLQGSFVRSDIALHYSNTAAVNFENAPILKNFDYRAEVADGVHAAFRHYNVDVIDTPHALEGYKVLLSPFLTTADENGLKERVIAWVKEGGTWIVGPMTDVMDANASKYTHAPYSFLEELAGVYVKYQKPVANDVFTAEWEDGTPFGAAKTYDAFEAQEGTEVLARYRGEFEGLAAATCRRVGKGKVILLGTLPSPQSLRRLAGLAPVLEGSENLVLTRRTGAHSGVIAVEVCGKAGYVQLDKTCYDVLGERTLTGRVEIAPFGVLVLENA